jgi:replication protein
VPSGEWIHCPQGGNPDFDVEPITLEDSKARHAPYSGRRYKAFQSMERLHFPNRRLALFANCGSGAWLQRNAEGEDLRIVSNKCHDRWCPACATEKGHRLHANLSQRVALHTCRFLTFTLRHSKSPLADQVDRLYRSFAVLRRRADFRAHVSGGISFFEAKISDNDGLWHPHLHVIVTGTWWDQREISAAWLAVTGDSSIVDVFAIGSTDGTARYVTKYVCKPAHESVYADPAKLDELVAALRGRRLYATFGTWRGWDADATPPDATRWISIAPLACLASRAANGEIEAKRYMYAAARRWPLLAIAYGWPPAPA